MLRIKSRPETPPDVMDALHGTAATRVAVSPARVICVTRERLHQFCHILHAAAAAVRISFPLYI